MADIQKYAPLPNPALRKGREDYPRKVNDAALCSSILDTQTVLSPVAIFFGCKSELPSVGGQITSSGDSGLADLYKGLEFYV
jgi:hypothetical protein